MRSHPTETEILECENNFEEIRSIVEKEPLIGSPIPLSILESEYKQNELFIEQFRSIIHEFPYIRRVRKDGCCFYRGYLSCIRLSLKNNPDLAIQFKSDIQNSYETVKSVGYLNETISDFFESFCSVFDTTSLKSNEDPMCNEEISNPAVVYARILTSTYIKLNEEKFENFLNGLDVEQFCRQNVDPMWKDVEQIQIVALTSILKIPLEIIYCDGHSKKPHKYTFPESERPLVYLLYTPGHYDILLNSI
ncbi:hypothetical protein ACR3K2_16100 [Cryptosporidium serpentis]